MSVTQIKRDTHCLPGGAGPSSADHGVEQHDRTTTRAAAHESSGRDRETGQTCYFDLKKAWG